METCSGNLENKITGTIPAFALGPRKTKKNLCRGGRSLDPKGRPNMPCTTSSNFIAHKALGFLQRSKYLCIFCTYKSYEKVCLYDNLSKCNLYDIIITNTKHLSRAICTTKLSPTLPTTLPRGIHHHEHVWKQSRL
jgi:hypothetical protein